MHLSIHIRLLGRYDDSLTSIHLEDVRSLSLPGTYHEKISGLGRSLRGFTRLKNLDLSRNAIVCLEVWYDVC